MKQTFSYTITDPNGLHARPAGLLVKRAQELGGEITVCLGDRSANLKKLLAVMGLGIRHGDTVSVTVEGENAAEIAESLQAFFQENV